MKDFYKILGVNKYAKIEDIKKAYRDSVKKYHPDTSDISYLEKFKEVSEAYRVLSDISKKREYDKKQNSSKYLRNSTRNFKDTPRSGSDVYFDIKLEASDFFKDFEKEIEYKISSGVESESKTINIKNIGPIFNGEKVRYSGCGNNGYNGGPTGDLIVKFELEDNLFKKYVNDGDLFLDFSIPFSLMYFGGLVGIPTPCGEVLKFYLQANTLPGEIFKFNKFGLYKDKVIRGDLYAIIKLDGSLDFSPEYKLVVDNLFELDKSNGCFNVEYDKGEKIWLLRKK